MHIKGIENVTKYDTCKSELFANIIGALNNVQAEYIEKCTRYIATDDTENLGLNKPKLKELIDFQRRPVHYL